MDKTEQEIKKIVFNFISPKDYKAFVFGSRATSKAKKYSDYDIGLIGKKPVPSLKLALIKDALEESNLPYNVDVVDFSLVSPSFKKVALLKTKNL